MRRRGLGQLGLARALAGALLGSLLTFGVPGATADDDGAGLRQKLGDVDLVGDWVYDDLDAGTALAKKSGKPLLVVLRCVP